MDIRTMQYYLAVIREGTISAAAQALHVAQPSLSRQMKELEDELGTTLFVRGNRKITLRTRGGNGANTGQLLGGNEAPVLLSRRDIPATPHARIFRLQKQKPFI